MQELIPNPRLLGIAEEINNEVWKAAQPLNKGPIKLDHGDVRSTIETAMLLAALRDLRDELRFANHEKRMSALTNSMFAQPKSSQPTGESP